MEVDRKGPYRGADDLIAVMVVLERVVFSIQHLLYGLDWQGDGDPVSGFGVRELVVADTVVGEPLMHLIYGRGAGTNKVFDLLSSQVLTVPLVIGIRHYQSGLVYSHDSRASGLAMGSTSVKLCDEFIETVLLEADLELDDLVARGSIQLVPYFGNGDSVLDSERGTLLEG